jgi:2Fe-2S ferredoxin
VVKVTITSLENKVLKPGKAPQSFLQLFAENRIDYMHACGGKGRCTTCKIEIVSGEESISQRTERELLFMDKELILKSERLSCQCKPMGEVIIKIPFTSRLPHITYSD